MHPTVAYSTEHIDIWFARGLAQGARQLASEEDFRRQTESASEAAAPVTVVPLAVQAAWLHAVRQVLAYTEDVGERFAEEARRIHHGEAPERGIRGKASPTETQALLDEGIAVMPLPIPDGMDGPVH